MIQLALFVTLLYTFINVSYAAERNPAYNYTYDGLLMVWHDEFNGTTLDTKNWWYDKMMSIVPNQLQYYTDSEKNLKVEDGNLVITAVKEDYKGATYTSAQINTRYKCDFKYGRFEARMKLTNVSGLQPTFFLYPTYEVYGAWPNSGQIIPMNAIGNLPNDVIGEMYFGQFKDEEAPRWGKTINNAGYSDDFHTFAVEWDEDEIRWYMDSATTHYYSITKKDWYSVNTAVSNYPQPAPFDQVFFITFNLAVGGDWPGAPSASTPFPQSIYIDYIRVYQNATELFTPIPEAGPAAAPGPMAIGTIIAIIVVVVFIIALLIALYFLYGYMARKRALSEAPLPETLENKHRETASAAVDIEEGKLEEEPSAPAVATGAGTAGRYAAAAPSSPKENQYNSPNSKNNNGRSKQYADDSNYDNYNEGGNGGNGNSKSKSSRSKKSSNSRNAANTADYNDNSGSSNSGKTPRSAQNSSRALMSSNKKY